MKVKNGKLCRVWGDPEDGVYTVVNMFWIITILRSGINYSNTHGYVPGDEREKV